MDNMSSLELLEVNFDIFSRLTSSLFFLETAENSKLDQALFINVCLTLRYRTMLFIKFNKVNKD